MYLRRLDDYQSWQVLFRGTSILIDPWLTPEPITGGFDRRHGSGFTTASDLRRGHESIGAVFLCTQVNDHTRPATLAQLADVPVHGPAKAVKIARNAGCSSTHVARPGSTVSVECPEGGRIVVTTTECGKPLGLIAVGYLIEGRDADDQVIGRIWIEPHQPTTSAAARVAPVDVAVLPCQSVTAVVLPVTAGPRTAAKAVEASRARALVPTATDPRRDMKVWQKTLYFVAGGIEATRRALGGRASLVDLRAGDWLDVKSGR